MRLARFLLISVLMTLCVTTARAESSKEVFETMTPDQVVKIMRDAGYRAEVVTKDGETHITTGLSGYRAHVDFYDCKSAGCSAIQYYAGFEKEEKYTLSYVNRWNHDKRYGKAYIDDDGGAILEYDIDLSGGVPGSYIKEQLVLFESALGSFVKF